MSQKLKGIDSTLSPKPLDFYNDDDVELDFLLSKPTTFLIIGKPFCGKTTLAKKLAQEWQCPFINPDDLVESAINLQTPVGQVCNKFLEQGLKIEQDLIFNLIKERMEQSELLNSGYVLDGFPSLSERGMHVPDQLALMDTWNVKPNVLIHVKMSDEDIIKRKKNSKTNAITGTTHVMEEFDNATISREEIPDDNNEFIEVMSEEDIALPVFDEDEFVKTDSITEENMVSISTQLMRQFIKDLDRYNRKFPILQNYFLHRAKMIRIELNANLPPKSLFKGLISTLKLMPVSRPIHPKSLSDAIDYVVQENSQLNEIIYSLNKVNMVAPFFRWRLSRWGQFCPVDLKDGNLSLGKFANPVVYRDKIYFLANNENLMRFLQNPRPFLIPPMPLHPCKFIIFGHIKTGKTNLAWKLSTKFKGRVIDFNKIMQIYTREMREQYLEEIWTESLSEVIAEIQTREILTAALYAERKRGKRIHDLALELALKTKEEQDKETSKKSKLHSKSRFSKDSESSQSASKYTEDSGESKVTHESPSVGSGSSTVEELYLLNLESETVLQKVEAEELELEIPLVGEDNHEVVTIINNIMEIAEAEEIAIEEERYIEQLIKEIEAQRLILNNYGTVDIRDGGWVIDNFPVDQKLFETAISMGVIPVCIIILKDPTDDYKIVSKRYVKTKFRKRTLITVVSHPSPTFEVQEPSASDETSSESAPDFDHLLEEELSIADIEEEESVLSDYTSTNKVEDEIIEIKPQLTESEIALIKLKGTLSQMDVFFDSLSKYLPNDGTVKIIPIRITNQSNLIYAGDSDGTTPEDEYQNMSRLDSSQQFHAMSDVQSQATRSELIAIHDIAATIPKIHKSPDDIALEVINSLDAEFYYKCRAINEVDKEQYEFDVQQNVDVIVDLKEGDDTYIKLLQLGDTGPYCPVSLKESQVLNPGKPNLEMKFKDKTYWFSSEEAKNEFSSKPFNYVADKRPIKLPPLRICIVGPVGSQRSEQARILASDLNIFHINFRERLQELLLPKSGRKLGFPYQTDQEQMDDEDEIMRNESRQESILTSLDLDSKESQVSAIWSEVEMSDDKSKIIKRSAQDTMGEETSQDLSEEPSFFTECFTEELRNYKDYLQNGTPIHESNLENLVSPWWHQEPYSSVGFVLDGFPSTLDEAEFLTNHGLMPDSIIFMIVSDYDVIHKLQKLCMTTWIDRRRIKKAKKEEDKQIAKDLRETGIALRRLQLEKDIKQKKTTKTKVESESIDTEEDQSELNVEEILAEEFPKIDEDLEDEETIEQAGNRYDTHLLEMLQKYEETSNLIKEKFQSQIPCYYIDGRKDAEKVSYWIRMAISPFVERRNNLFEKTYSITLSLAQKLIESGYKTRTNFGYWCPVRVYEGAIIPNVYVKDYEPYPVLHRHHIYYLSSKAARHKFMQEPMKYICQPIPQPIVPINIAVVGTPFSGKSALVKRFAKEYNLIRLTGKQVLKYVTTKLSSTTISDYIHSCLEKGDVIAHDLIAAAVDEVMMHPVCQQQGIILDGIPNSLELALALTERNIIPFCIFELKLPLKEVVKRVVRKESSMPSRHFLKTSQELLKFQYEMIVHELEQLQEYYRNKHHNWVSLDANRSQWWLWTHSSVKFLDCVKCVQNYIVSAQKGEAADLSNMNLTPDEFKLGLGVFKHFCPVSLAIDGELIDCFQDKEHQFCAEYNGKYYAMCSYEHLKMFIGNPEVFLPPRAIRLPPKANEIPEMISLQKCLKYAKNQIEFEGFCTVTYLQGFKTYESVVRGNPNFGVIYNSKLYLMASEEKRKIFMKKPEQFAHLKFPNKIPPELQLVDVLGLPILGYLEQTVSKALFKALTAIAVKKPIYPFLDISMSAALFLAYHFKAYNPKSPAYIRKKYLEKLKEYEQHCHLLQYVVKNMTLMPFKSESRPVDFETKLQSFYQLKPAPEWFNQLPKIPKTSDANFQTM